MTVLLTENLDFGIRDWSYSDWEGGGGGGEGGERELQNGKIPGAKLWATPPPPPFFFLLFFFIKGRHILLSQNFFLGSFSGGCIG